MTVRIILHNSKRVIETFSLVSETFGGTSTVDGHGVSVFLKRVMADDRNCTPNRVAVVRGGFEVGSAVKQWQFGLFEKPSRSIYAVSLSGKSVSSFDWIDKSVSTAKLDDDGSLNSYFLDFLVSLCIA